MEAAPTDGGLAKRLRSASFDRARRVSGGCLCTPANPAGSRASKLDRRNRNQPDKPLIRKEAGMRDVIE